MCDLATVLPSKPIQGHVIKLSLTDVYSPKVWVLQTHFWPCKEVDSIDSVYAALRQGLSRTLSEVPGLAGKTGRTSDDPRDLIITISDAAHVEFALDDLTSNASIPSYDELKAAVFPMTLLNATFAPSITLRPVTEGAPMFVAKLNKLKGGMALSFGFNHLLADASTVAEVERIWSLHTADASTGREQQSYKGSTDDESTRLRMSTPAPGTSTAFEDPYWKVFPTRLSQLGLSSGTRDTEAALAMVRKAQEERTASLGLKLDTSKWCMWYFSPAQLAQLKIDCSAGLASGEWISTIDALIGLFWSRILFAKKAGRDEAKEKSILLFPINIRSRLNPPLHPQYVGNAVDIVATDVPIAQLEADSIEGWTAAARAVRTAVNGWKEDAWESWLAMAKALPSEEAICPNPLTLVDPHNMMFNDYSRSQSNTLNWGKHIGVADRTRYMKPAGSMQGCATGVIVHPRLADGGLEVASGGTDSLKDALIRDPVFGKYAQFECAFA